MQVLLGVKKRTSLVILMQVTSQITKPFGRWKTFLKLFHLDLPGRQFFFDERYFRFCLYFISKKWLYLFIKVLLSVMSLALILLAKFFFSLLIKLAQRLHCLLYAFLSMSLFVFKNLFLRRDLFMISLFVYLFIYERRLICSKIPLFLGSMSLNSFI